MSEILIKWLNEEIHLSKQITNISQDFKTGYLFAELLYKTKQLQNLSEYKNTLNKKDIIHNFCLLDQVLLRMGIILKEKDRDEMINESIFINIQTIYKSYIIVMYSKTKIKNIYII